MLSCDHPCRLACARAPTARCTRDHVACQNSSSIPFSRSDIRPSAVIRASVRLQERRRGPPFPCAATQAAADAASEQTIQALLSWLVANGVEGVGQDAKAALYVGEAGERGLVAVAPLKRGETVFKIPLKLAITDHPGNKVMPMASRRCSSTVLSIDTPACVFDLLSPGVHFAALTRLHHSCLPFIFFNPPRPAKLPDIHSSFPPSRR